jgi:hypothetical protein
MSIDEFIHKKSYEKVLYKLRRHLVTFLPAFAFFIIMLILPAILYFILRSQMPGWFTNPTSLTLLTLLGSVYILSVLIFLYSYFIDFYLDVLIVTNDRLVDMEQHGLFARTISEVDLYQIQDITSECKGIFHTMFDFGSIIIQTAGALPKFTVHNIKKPHEMRKIILDLVEEDRKYHHGEAIKQATQ